MCPNARHIRRGLAALAVAALPLLLTACSGGGSHTLGAPLTQASVTTVRDLKPAAQPVALHGTMVEKCPVAGCWFMLRDKTGLVKVDTKGAGFVVSSVPLNTEVTVQGKFLADGERRVAATGMRY